MLKESYFPWNQTLVICLIPVLFWNRPITAGDRTTDKLRLPSLDICPGGIRLKLNIEVRRGGDVDRLLHPPLLDLHLLTLTKRAEDHHKKRRRRYTSSSSFSSDSQSHDYGRYKRTRHSPQAVQNTNILQPVEITNVQTILPEQTLQHPSKDSGSDSEIETWSFDRAINEVFRLLPAELCPRPSEEHTPSKRLHYYTPGIQSMQWGYIVFVFSVCLSVC